MGNFCIHINFFSSGLFAGGVYISLRFTLLAPPEQQGAADRARAVLCLFPIVAGIFLVFAWILADQLFIQVRKKEEWKQYQICN